MWAVKILIYTTSYRNIIRIHYFLLFFHFGSNFPKGGAFHCGISLNTLQIQYQRTRFQITNSFTSLVVSKVISGIFFYRKSTIRTTKAAIETNNGTSSGVSPSFGIWKLKHWWCRLFDPTGKKATCVMLFHTHQPILLHLLRNAVFVSGQVGFPERKLSWVSLVQINQSPQDSCRRVIRRKTKSM